MTNWQKKYCCKSVNYLSKSDEKIFFNKKLTTFAERKATFLKRFSDKRKINGKEFSNS